MSDFDIAQNHQMDDIYADLNLDQTDSILPKSTKKRGRPAKKHGKEKKYNAKEIKQLKLFFNNCLDKNKLLKTKEVAYDKKTQEVNDVPGLLYGNNNFTIRNDGKRVSTLKSLAPKRGTEKLKPTAENNINTSEEK